MPNPPSNTLDTKLKHYNPLMSPPTAPAVKKEQKTDDPIASPKAEEMESPKLQQPSQQNVEQSKTTLVKKKAYVAKKTSKDYSYKNVLITSKNWIYLVNTTREIQNKRVVKFPRITENSLIRISLDIVSSIKFDTDSIESEEDLKQRILTSMKKKGMDQSDAATKPQD